MPTKTSHKINRLSFKFLNIISVIFLPAIFILPLIYTSTEKAKFRDAIYANNITLAQTLLTKTPDLIHTQITAQQELLEFAAINKDLDLINLHFKNKCDAPHNEPHRLNKNALHHIAQSTPIGPNPKASHKNTIQIAKILLTQKTDINQKDILGMTPLFLAILNDQYSLTELFLDYDANTNIPEHTHNLTPLHLAVITHNPALVLALLQKNANPAAIDKFNKTPADYLIDQTPEPNKYIFNFGHNGYSIHTNGPSSYVKFYSQQNKTKIKNLLSTYKK